MIDTLIIEKYSSQKSLSFMNKICFEPASQKARIEFATSSKNHENPQGILCKMIEGKGLSMVSEKTFSLRKRAFTREQYAKKESQNDDPLD